MEKEKQENRRTKQLALIGLIGSILTVCGGIGGALIGGLTTIYKLEQKAQQLSITAPEDESSLTVDTRQISITSFQAGNLDEREYLVLDNLGFVMSQPKDGWEPSGEIKFYDLFLEESTNLSPLILFYAQVGTAWDEQSLYRLRYVEPAMIQYVEGSTENGISVDPAQLDNDTIAFYSQMNILALEKNVAQEYSIYDLALDWAGMHKGGVNSIVSNPDSQYVFEQVSWELEAVRLAGQPIDLTLQRWALFAEGTDHYYIVEVQYVPVDGQSSQVLADIQEYLSAFRVIR